MSEVSREEMLAYLERHLGPDPDLDCNCPRCSADRVTYLAVRAFIESKPKVTRERVRELVGKYVQCTCDAAYKDRGLSAPDCPRHSFFDEYDCAALLRELGIEVSDEA